MPDLAGARAGPTAGRCDATVVVTHFAPSAASADPRFGQQPSTASFCNDDQAMIVQAELWLHGHVHCCHDYTVARGSRRAYARGLQCARSAGQERGRGVRSPVRARGLSAGRRLKEHRHAAEMTAINGPLAPLRYSLRPPLGHLEETPMKILVAVDGSKYTKRMLAYLAAHDEWFGRKPPLHGADRGRRRYPGPGRARWPTRSCTTTTPRKPRPCSSRSARSLPSRASTPSSSTKVGNAGEADREQSRARASSIW